MSEPGGNKAGAELRNGESGRDEEKQGPSLRMGDVELILHEKHQRSKNETSYKIQQKEGCNEEYFAGSSAERLWNGT